jgi:hypothetical protein
MSQNRKPHRRTPIARALIVGEMHHARQGILPEGVQLSISLINRYTRRVPRHDDKDVKAV